MSIKNLPADYLLAAQQGDIDKVKTCLALGVDINTCDRQGKTAITLASLYQQYACVQALIDAGADINKQDHTCLNPFLISCLNDDLTLLRIILPAKPDLNCVTRFGGVGLTPACEKGHLSIVKELLAHTEINVNQTNHVGWTPLLEAIVLNDGGIKQQAIVQLLLEHGASPHLTDKYGKTPLELARERLTPFGERINLFHLCYSGFEEALDELGWERIDAALIDIGVSSLQLDEAERGFSFNSDGPLDMRMDQHSGRDSAWHWVNREHFAALKECIATLGEEPQAGRIARAIVDARQKGPIDTTLQLAHIVEMAYPPAWRAKARRHPATRTFQALRMAVNDELGELRRFLDAVLGRLRVGGRLAVISFHSLEDRMVKQAMRHWAEGCRCPRHVPRCVCGHVPEVRLLHKKPVTACESEVAANPRSSCAKLRAVEKIAEAVS